MAEELETVGNGEFGRYRLARLLGRGGMGEVHLARDSSLDRDVAIKFIAPEKVGDADARRRLVREARAAAGLDHPGICAVHETGETPDGRTYIVMQYVEGRPLTDVLRGPLLPVRDALVLCARIAEALDTAHRHGIVHRDLKPANVILTPAGQPKLVDFGLAKVLTARVDVDADTTATATTAGVILGTAGYMSPEQAQQRLLDGRSDLFSLGALLFECLTGRRAFQGATTLETIAKVLHWHPPDPSSLRRELDERHDELCRRLLAKDPADRFQSAQEVVGAIRLLVSDTSRSNVIDDPAARWNVRRPRRVRVTLAIAALLAVAAGAIWMWPRGGLAPAPADAEVWYKRGTDALREGAYYTASQALEKAVAIFPGYTLAYARLAEARAELDDQRGAQESLLRVVVPARLAKPERLRLEAVRSLVLRELDPALASYSELTRINPRDAGAWLDLGRAQEAAGLSADARSSYERAIAADGQYAPAYVRLGFVEGQASRRNEAIAAFRHAEHLYQAAVDVEGQAEVLLRRGAMFDSFNDLKSARADLERALSLATDVGATYQQVRARLSLSSVTASEGRLDAAQRAGLSAVQDALSRGLETVAAAGLLDLAASVMQAGNLADAESHARRAVQLADQQGARRTAARGRLQLAAIYEQQEKYQAALDLVGTVLPFLKEHRYRRFELLGLSIASRAHSGLDALDEAQRLSASVLEIAEKLQNEGQVALAAANLASATTALGNYPEALRLRLRAEEIHKRQGDNGALPYDLANRADLLIRLGRAPEADAVLKELEAGIAAGLDSFVTRETRALFFRAFAAVTSHRCNAARPFLRRLRTFGPARTLPGVLGPAITQYCAALDRRSVPPSSELADLDPSLARERLYWLAAAAMYGGDWPRAQEYAASGLKLLGKTSNDELRWRLATVAAVAAREMKNESVVSGFLATAGDALARLQSQWGNAFAAYARRQDLADLKSRADRH